MKTIILGIGNPILSDDGVGIYVVRELRREVKDPDVFFAEESISGLDIIDVLRGFDRLILVDAIQTEGGRPGEVYRLGLEDIERNPTIHYEISHDIDVGTAIRLGRELGEDMPSEVIVYAIEVENVQDFSEECTPDVRKAIPSASRRIMDEI